MGVDYTAFACYGVRLSCPERDIDKIDEVIPRKLNVSILEWGSRPYGGSWGYVLTFGNTYEEVDLRRDAGVRMFPSDRDFDRLTAVLRLQDAVDVIKKAGIACAFDGEPGWMVGGRIW